MSSNEAQQQQHSDGPSQYVARDWSRLASVQTLGAPDPQQVRYQTGHHNRRGHSQVGPPQARRAPYKCNCRARFSSLPALTAHSGSLPSTDANGATGDATFHLPINGSHHEHEPITPVTHDRSGPPVDQPQMHPAQHNSDSPANLIDATAYSHYIPNFWTRTEPLSHCSHRNPTPTGCEFGSVSTYGTYLAQGAVHCSPAAHEYNVDAMVSWRAAVDSVQAFPPAQPSTFDSQAGPSYTALSAFLCFAASRSSTVHLDQAQPASDAQSPITSPASELVRLAHSSTRVDGESDRGSGLAGNYHRRDQAVPHSTSQPSESTAGQSHSQHEHSARSDLAGPAPCRFDWSMLQSELELPNLAQTRSPQSFVTSWPAISTASSAYNPQSPFTNGGEGPSSRRNSNAPPTNPSLRRYPCSFCQVSSRTFRTFARPSALKIHMLTHTKVKPHTCSVCQRAFAVRSNLKRHLKIHDEVRLELQVNITATAVA